MWNTPPILFLIFNRPDLVERSFAPIRAAKPERLFIAADGPRPERDGEAEFCRQSRAIVDQIDWDCDVKTLFREENLGCRYAVSTGITWFFEQVEAGVIIEDDCVADASFFPFCAELLERYRDNERVMCVSGESYGDESLWGSRMSYTYSAYPLFWGWATWRRAWEKYDSNLRTATTRAFRGQLTSYLKNPLFARYWLSELARAADDTIDTWGYRWIYSVLQANGLCVIPRANLVSNIGCDARATHTVDEQWDMANRPLTQLALPLRRPDRVARDLEFESILMHERMEVDRFRKRNRLSKRILRKLRGVKN